MVATGGYGTHPGLYRVPDLLTEEQFKDYMWEVYRRRVEFSDTENYVDPSRALGRGVAHGVLEETVNEHRVNDPVLRKINEMDFSTPSPRDSEENKEESKENKEPEPPVEKKTTSRTTSSK